MGERWRRRAKEKKRKKKKHLRASIFFFVISFLSRNFYLESETFPVKPSLHLNAETIQKSHIWCGISALTNAWNQRWTCQLQLFLLQSSIFKTRALISKLRLAKLWQLCFDLIEIKRCSNSLQRFVVANGSWSPITRVYKCRDLSKLTIQLNRTQNRNNLHVLIDADCTESALRSALFWNGARTEIPSNQCYQNSM